MCGWSLFISWLSNKVCLPFWWHCCFYSLFFLLAHLSRYLSVDERNLLQGVGWGVWCGSKQINLVWFSSLKCRNFIAIWRARLSQITFPVNVGVWTRKSFQLVKEGGRIKSTNGIVAICCIWCPSAPRVLDLCCTVVTTFHLCSHKTWMSLTEEFLMCSTYFSPHLASTFLYGLSVN